MPVLYLDTSIHRTSTLVLPADRLQAVGPHEVVITLQVHKEMLEATLRKISDQSPVYLHTLGAHAEISLALLLAKEALIPELRRRAVSPT